MEADMPCRNHPDKSYQIIDGVLQCPVCHLASPYQPVAIDKIIHENKKNADKLLDIKRILEGTGTATHKLAEVQLILEDD